MRAAVVCVVLSMFACGDDDGVNPGDPADAGQEPGCQTSADCSGDTPVCDTARDVCVQCTVDEANACTGDTPVCAAATQECTGCTVHTDCAESNACLPTGACAASAEVLYVASAGTDNAECSQAMPCGNLTQALAVTPARAIVKVEGEIVGPTIEIAGRDLTILGEPTMPGARLAAMVANTPIVRITGVSNVRMFDLIITGASGVTGFGVLTETGSGDLELQRCTVTGNDVGIRVNTSTALIVGRSIISLNLHGGIIVGVLAARFDLTNNFVFRNGGNDSGAGGIAISVGLAPDSRVEFNTIVDNEALDGAARSGGLLCDINGFSASNNIIASNEVSDMAGDTNSQVVGICNFSSSIVLAEAADLHFESPNSAPFSYKLTTGSIAIDDSQVGTPPPIDFEGEPRPNGPFADVGADEFYAD